MRQRQAGLVMDIDPNRLIAQLHNKRHCLQQGNCWRSIVDDVELVTCRNSRAQVAIEKG
jgi:hypothetical protein